MQLSNAGMWQRGDHLRQVPQQTGQQLTQVEQHLASGGPLTHSCNTNRKKYMNMQPLHLIIQMSIITDQSKHQPVMDWLIKVSISQYAPPPLPDACLYMFFAFSLFWTVGFSLYSILKVQHGKLSYVYIVVFCVACILWYLYSIVRVRYWKACILWYLYSIVYVIENRWRQKKKASKKEKAIEEINMGGTALKFKSWKVQNHIQNASQHHYYCFLIEIWILKSGFSWKSPMQE